MANAAWSSQRVGKLLSDVFKRSHVSETCEAGRRIRQNQGKSNWSDYLQLYQTHLGHGQRVRLQWTQKEGRELLRVERCLHTFRFLIRLAGQLSTSLK